MHEDNGCGCREYTRREMLLRGMKGAGLLLGAPALWRLMATEIAAAEPKERILVVVELSGGNDGLNTLVPYTNDIYYANRPAIAIPAARVRKLDGEVGLHPALEAFERLFKDGRLAIVQGCSYPNPNRSHFEAMEFWHTGVPNGSDPSGWLGRWADAAYARPQDSLFVNIDARQSLAVRSARHPSVVFDDPRQFARRDAQRVDPVLHAMESAAPPSNETLGRLRELTALADRTAAFVRDTCAAYRTPVAYGSANSLGGDLTRVAALIDAGMPARVYYTSFGGFDTHAGQGGAEGSQARLLGIVGQAIEAFLDDMRRQGRAEDVAVLVFTEFGRRLKENASRGTDHGVATPVFLAGGRVRGGLYSRYPSLQDLDQGDLKMTTDYRRVYASILDEWFQFKDVAKVLREDFPRLGILA